MEPTRFDELTKALATSASRRQILKTITASTLGGILGLSGIGNVFAKPCIAKGHHCNSNTVCCTHYCSPTTKTCTCPPAPACNNHCPCPTGQTCQNGQCVTAGCATGCTVLSNGTCARMCSIAADCACGSQFCGSHLSGGVLMGAVCTVLGNSMGACTDDSNCPIGYYCNGSGNCDQACC